MGESKTPPARARKQDKAPGCGVTTDRWPNGGSEGPAAAVRRGRGRALRKAFASVDTGIPEAPPQIRLLRLHLVSSALDASSNPAIPLAAIVWRKRFSVLPERLAAMPFAIASHYPAQGIFHCFPGAETALRSSRKPLHTALQTVS